MMNRFFIFPAIFALCQPAHADDVARQAEAIYFLRAVQSDFIRQADVSSEIIRLYAAQRARTAGVAANCRGVTSEQLPDEAELARVALSNEVGALLVLLAQFSTDHVVLPTSGTYRNEFLAGWGQGCVPSSSIEPSQISSAFKAINSIILLESDIQSRRQDIIRRLDTEAD